VYRYSFWVLAAVKEWPTWVLTLGFLVISVAFDPRSLPVITATGLLTTTGRLLTGFTTVLALALPAIVNGFFGAWLPWTAAALTGTTTLPEGFEEVVLAPLFGAFPACSPDDALIGLTAFFTAALALGAGAAFALGLAGFSGFFALATALLLVVTTFFFAPTLRPV
jgi:hypothetical protein